MSSKEAFFVRRNTKVHPQLSTGRPPIEPCCSSPTHEEGEGRPSAAYPTDAFRASPIPTPVDRPPSNGTQHPSSPTDIAAGRLACLYNVVKQRWGLGDTRETAQALTAQPPNSPFKSCTCEHGPQTLPSKRIDVLLLLLAPSPAWTCARWGGVPAYDIAVIVRPEHPNLRPARQQR